MKTIVLATGNRDKAAEIKEMLGGRYDVLTMGDAGIDVDIVEDGDSYEANALIKVHAIAPFLKDKDVIIMADDSGLSVDALDGAPGIYSARYAGEHVTYTDNNEKLLAAMAEVPADKRGAAFVCAIAMILPNGEEKTVRGEVRGSIAFELTGNRGFGYDPLFLVEGDGRSFAQMDANEKNAMSHRARAVAEAQKVLEAAGL